MQLNTLHEELSCGRRQPLLSRATLLISFANGNSYREAGLSLRAFEAGQQYEQFSQLIKILGDPGDLLEKDKR